MSEAKTQMKLKPCNSFVVDQAVIVITLTKDGNMTVSSRNNGRSKCAKMADAIVKMSGAVIEHGVPSKPKQLEGSNG